MYAGTVVETAPVQALFDAPRHPIRAACWLGAASAPAAQMPVGIPGSVPNLLHPPAGCRFQARCPSAAAACAVKRPPSVELAPGHGAACLLLTPVAATAGGRVHAA